jgi:hypothetical protein
MARQLEELKMLSEEHNAPILCAGDVFHRFNPPPELIHFAIKNVPKMYAVPGQHDLPHHVQKDLHRTAYGCLVEAGVICNVKYGKPQHCYVGDIRVHGFPWGTPITKLEKKETGVLDIALAHQFVWVKGKGYKGADPEAKIARRGKVIDSYDFAVFGDNHIPFKSGRAVNNGTFMRRNATEVNQRPMVSLLYDAGLIKLHQLETPDLDEFIDMAEGFDLAGKFVDSALDLAHDLNGFTDKLSELNTTAFDFVGALKRYCDREGITDNVRAAIMEATGR